MNCIHDVIRSQSFIYFQLLRFLLEIMNDWSNIKNTKQFVILLDYAFLSRKCIFMFICKETLQKLSEKVDSFGSHKKNERNFSRCFFSVTYNFYMLSMFLLSLKPILLDLVIPLNKTRPYILIIPMSWYTGEEKYFLKILLFQFLICIVVGLCVISSSSVYLIILQHICAMFQVTGWVSRSLSFYFLLFFFFFV